MLINYIPWLCYCYIYCISSANLYHMEENHELKFQFCSSSFFLSLRNLTQSYSVHANIPHTKRLLCYRASSFLVWGCIQATTGKLQPRNYQLLSPKTLRVGRRLSGLLFNYSGCGTYRQDKPRLLNACNSERRSSTMVSSIYLALKTDSVQPKTPLCIKIPFGSQQRDSVHFQGK